ncbi:MAG: flippase [Methanobacteriaceae archaeon]|nr:flippase [Methanobacteriaceae archaeon]
MTTEKENKKSKLAEGSIIVLLGSFIFRIGGFLYRFILSRILDAYSYGIFGLALPFQNFLTITAAGGIPPAIAKYVAEYTAVDNEEMSRQIIITATKLIISMGVIGALIMFMIAEPIAIGWWHKPDALLPLQLVSIIAPFSVIVGALRGAFQGYYQMTNILYSRAVEQIFTILVAVILVLVGWKAAGAIMGSVIGFLMSIIIAYWLYKRDVKDKYFTGTYRKITRKEEMELLWVILKFSIPVVITGIAEISLYDLGTLFIGAVLTSNFAGYYTNASAVARLPLIISNAVATSALPAASEALSLNNIELMKTYISQTYRYSIMTIFPLSGAAFVFASPILGLLFGSEYVAGSMAMKILVLGMILFGIYIVSSSLCQGLGKPRGPMRSLIIGTIINVFLSVILVSKYGIEGAALSTAVAAAVIMILTVYQTYKYSSVVPPINKVVRIALSTIFMMICLSLLPQSTLGIILAVFVAPVTYFLGLLITASIEKEDIIVFKGMINKLGPLSKYVYKIGNKFKRFIK